MKDKIGYLLICFIALIIILFFGYCIYTVFTTTPLMSEEKKCIQKGGVPLYEITYYGRVTSYDYNSCDLTK